MITRRILVSAQGHSPLNHLMHNVIERVKAGRLRDRVLAVRLLPGERGTSGERKESGDVEFAAAVLMFLGVGSASCS